MASGDDSSEYFSVEILVTNPLEKFLDVSDLLIRFASNILKDPQNVKYRKIRVSNPIVQNRLLPVEGAIECLFEMGFEEVRNKRPSRSKGQIFAVFLGVRGHVCIMVSIM